MRTRLRATWAQLTGTGTAASIGLALLVGICVLVCVAAPRASLHNRTRALQHLFAAMPVAERSVDAQVDYDDFAVGAAAPSRRPTSQRVALSCRRTSPGSSCPSRPRTPTGTG